MSAKRTPGPKPLTAKEQRMLDRLQIKWSRGLLTGEQKQHALALSNRAWEYEKYAIAKAEGSAA